MNMVVSHRETSISSNIRAIIEQLNLNPVERRRLIDRTCDSRIRPTSSPAKITIGVYGCRDKTIESRRDYLIKKDDATKIEVKEVWRKKPEERQKFDNIWREKFESEQIWREKPEKKEKFESDQIWREKPEKKEKVEVSRILQEKPEVKEKLESNQIKREKPENKEKVELSSILREKPEEQEKFESNQIRRENLKEQDKFESNLIWRDKPEKKEKFEVRKILREKPEAKEKVDSNNRNWREQPMEQEKFESNLVWRDKPEQWKKFESDQIPRKKSEEREKSEFLKEKNTEKLKEKNDDNCTMKIDKSPEPDINMSDCTITRENPEKRQNLKFTKVSRANSERREKFDFFKEKTEEKSKEKNDENYPKNISIDKTHSKSEIDISDWKVIRKNPEKIEDKNRHKTKIEIHNNENSEIETTNDKNVEKLRIEIGKEKNSEKLRIEILKGDSPPKVIKESQIVTPVTTPNGTVTIGVWGQSRTELRVERGGSFGKVIRKQEVDDESQCVVVSRSRKAEMRQRIPPEQKDIIEVTEVTRTQDVERVTSPLKEDLPELESASLNHTAAHHRIAIRPKNRRPPRRTTPTSCTPNPLSSSTDTLDSLEPLIPSATSSPVEPKPPSILRKSSSRLSRNCDLFEELESKLPRKPTSLASLSPDSLDSTARTIIDHSESEDSKDPKMMTRRSSNQSSEVSEEPNSRLPRRRSTNRLSKSPDSLENSFSKSSEAFDKFLDHEQGRPPSRRLSSSISNSTEVLDKATEAVEVRALPRRIPSAISKSTEGFDKLTQEEPRPVVRRLLLPMSKSSDLVSKISKSSDSLEVLEAMTSDDSMERRRSSFEIRPRRGLKAMSMSSENFEALGQVQEQQKRSSASDVNLSRGKRHCKVISKSSESFEAMETSQENRGLETGKVGWRSAKRVSSESSDYFDEEKSERKTRRPKRVSSSTVIDVFPREVVEGEKGSIRRRVQKSSESSELGSTDTLDSERRGRSESTETLDSLEKDGEVEGREDETDDKRDKHDSWMKPEPEPAKADNSANEESKSPEKNYWRQTSESKENIDIHQLLALTIVSRISDNGNNQRNNSVQFPKKKLASPPTSPIKEDNKLLFNNLLSSKNDEDLQNMLNGNISEVSTDTKSFKEKLIMFEKLGK